MFSTAIVLLAMSAIPGLARGVDAAQGEAFHRNLELCASQLNVR